MKNQFREAAPSLSPDLSALREAPLPERQARSVKPRRHSGQTAVAALDDNLNAAPLVVPENPAKSSAPHSSPIPAEYVSPATADRNERAGIGDQQSSGAAPERPPAEAGQSEFAAPDDAMPIPAEAMSPPKAGRIITAGIGNPSSSAAGLELPATAGRKSYAALDDTLAQLRDLQRRRRYLIQMKSRGDRATESYLAGWLGAGGLPKGERKKIYKRAGLLMDMASYELATSKKVEEIKAKLSEKELALYNSELLLISMNAQASDAWDRQREVICKAMSNIAEGLPGYNFVSATRGVSALGFAVIVGECGDPTSYRDKHTLFKRLGIGVVDGIRQGGLSKVASKDDWIKHGYNPQRRSEIFVFLSDTMLRSQWAGDKDVDGKDPKKTGKPVAVPAHALGHYGEIYGRQKLIYLAREWEPGHSDRAARRYASQHFIKDLRNAWRAAFVCSLPEGGQKPNAASHAPFVK